MKALRSKDPRIYDKDAKFYNEAEEDGSGEGEAKKKDTSMTLRQFHTQNLLEGRVPGEDEDAAPPRTYAQEQEEIRKSLVNAAADEEFKQSPGGEVVRCQHHRPT